MCCQRDRYHSVPENKIQQLYAGYEIPRLGCVEVESDTGSLPDRLINLGKCERVLFTTEEHTAAESAENRVLVNEDPRRLTPL